MENRYDAIIVGGGPAGLSAAIYMARARFHVLVIEKEKMGGQITITSEVVNYPGVYKTDGEALTREMVRQAEAFGAEFLTAEVKSLSLAADTKVVHTDRGDFEAMGIIYAAGAHPRLAGFSGEKEFRGHGVAYCATCDGEFFTGKDIFVVGGGYAAVEEALFLTKYGRKVHVLVRGDDFSISSAAVDELKEHPDVTISYHTEVVRIEGDSAVRCLVLKDRKSGEERLVEAKDGDYFGVFVFVGYAPESGLLKGQIELDPAGYVVTDREQQTNLPGVYAAGDICVKQLRQVVTAVSDGAVAATSLERYLGNLYRRLGLRRTYARKKVVKEEKTAPKAVAGAFLDDAMREALSPVLARFEKPLLLRVSSDGTLLADEAEGLVRELASLSDTLSYEVVREGNPDVTISICSAEGKDLGLRFHGVPGGHEFNSFILALYNAAGPGQDVGEILQQRIEEISRDIHIDIAVSLSCTMCPDLVAAAERIAADNDHVSVDVYDLAHYPDMQKKYNIMSVPCLIMDGKTYFGKKSLEELLQIIR